MRLVIEDVLPPICRAEPVLVAILSEAELSAIVPAVIVAPKDSVMLPVANRFNVCSVELPRLLVTVIGLAFAGLPVIAMPLETWQFTVRLVAAMPMLKL